ncbi:hypothetical protein GJ654_16220 [Rhodoblastus acidophilus]|uniref:Uncharacterized protein n=1 Tax=Rhodoblastus acidophilus TaxID=1074 RepID=A0A6N8DPL7_RHOAC|nr:hypothetical protein [Rhodoblastus acidophilus]MCW2274586.1 hypothetical protein [Rhodoblastus acidophilus]MTV32532.1 hypothetical protein [Rhodoblastus acidophilus]
MFQYVQQGERDGVGFAAARTELRDRRRLPFDPLALAGVFLFKGRGQDRIAPSTCDTISERSVRKSYSTRAEIRPSPGGFPCDFVFADREAIFRKPYDFVRDARGRHAIQSPCAALSAWSRPLGFRSSGCGARVQARKKR